MMPQSHSWGNTQRKATQVTPEAPAHPCLLQHYSQERAKLWKQQRWPTTDEWIKKMWYLYTMEFYSSMKKNEILSFADKWMVLDNIILSEVSQTQKIKNHMFSLICRL
jgi:hypothetical protein